MDDEEAPTIVPDPDSPGRDVSTSSIKNDQVAPTSGACSLSVSMSPGDRSLEDSGPPTSRLSLSRGEDPDAQEQLFLRKIRHRPNSLSAQSYSSYDSRMSYNSDDFLEMLGLEKERDGEEDPGEDMEEDGGDEKEPETEDGSGGEEKMDMEKGSDGGEETMLEVIGEGEEEDDESLPPLPDEDDDRQLTELYPPPEDDDEDDVELARALQSETSPCHSPLPVAADDDDLQRSPQARSPLPAPLPKTPKKRRAADDLLGPRPPKNPRLPLDHGRARPTTRGHSDPVPRPCHLPTPPPLPLATKHLTRKECEVVPF